jgi:hypothetical protein
VLIQNYRQFFCQALLTDADAVLDPKIRVAAAPKAANADHGAPLLSLALHL